MHNRRLVLGLAMVTLGMAACAGLGGPPTVRLTQSEIERLVERNFPVDRALLEIFDVTVHAPRVTLVPERNRLAAVVSVRARNRLFATTWQGQLSFDAALRWEARDQTVHLWQVRVQDLAWDKPDAFTRSAAERLGAALAERVLEDSTIYRLPADRAARLQQAGYAPATIDITGRGVEITFAPIAQAPATR